MLKLEKMYLIPDLIDQVHRYSRDYQVDYESVKTHSADVAYIAISLANDIIRHTDLDIDYKKLLLSCLFHDIGEGVTADVSRNVKYSSPVVKSSLDELEEGLAEQLMQFVDLDNLFTFYKNAKDVSIEGLIVRLADWLSVLFKINSEFQKGNLKFSRVRNEFESNIIDSGAIRELLTPELSRKLTEPQIKYLKLYLQNISLQSKEILKNSTRYQEDLELNKLLNFNLKLNK